MHNREDAEDLAQEVFIEVFQSINNFRGEASLSTWIYRIAVTKSLELKRKRNRKKRMAYFKSLLNMNQDPDDTEDRKFFHHPGIEMENKERAHILFQTIDQLPQNQRIAFTLNKIEHLSYREVATIMETSLSAVESLIYRARNNLKQKLQSYYEKNG